MKKTTCLAVAMVVFCGVMLSGRASEGPEVLAGVKTKAEIEALVAKLRSGELTGAQNLFQAEDGPYRVYTSYIDNRKGAADLHGVDHEIFLIVSGRAEVTLGGDLVDKEVRSEHEFRGTGITGGTTRSVQAGDMISIPCGTAHQMNPGTGHVLYIVIKMMGADKD